MANDLLIVIATSGRPELLRRTLASLAECRKPEIYRETLVVENGPKAGAEEVVRAFQKSLNARYLYVAQGNKSHALNAALGPLEDCLIFFTDDDVRVHPETLCAYAKAAEGVSGGLFYGGPTGVDYEREPPDWLKVYLPPSARGWGLDGKIHSIQEPVLLGCNWAAFSIDLKAAGGFNPHVGPGAVTGSTGQETDMQRRLLGMGFQARYLPAAKVWHYVPAERCSPKWAMQRAYRKGLDSGMGYLNEVPTLFGTPRWMVRVYLKKAAQLLVRRISRDRGGSFDAYYDFECFRGYMHGARLARKNPSAFGNN